jgi:cohesin complex subunit SCC1
MGLLAIREDPLAHFLPTKVTPNGTFFCAAPPGLAPQLAELFMRPVGNAVPPKRRAVSPDKSPSKRPRLEENAPEEQELEQGRRAVSVAPSHGLGSDVLGRGSIGPEGILDFPDTSGGIEEFQLEVPGYDGPMGGDVDMGQRRRSLSAPLSPLSRLTTPGPEGLPIEEGDESYADAACPIAMFDARPSSSQTQTQTTEKEGPAGEHDEKGYSKNTIKAVAILRHELRPVAGEEDQEKVLSFRKMADKVRCFFGNQRWMYETHGWMI